MSNSRSGTPQYAEGNTAGVMKNCTSIKKVAGGTNRFQETQGRKVARKKRKMYFVRGPSY